MSDAPSVGRQVGRGLAAMLARYIFVTPLSFLASVLLARLLTPGQFGTYATVTVLVMGLGSLFELGIMSVLIQQKEAPTPREMRTVFTVYLGLFGGLATALALAAPYLAPFFNLPLDGPLMLRWMSLHMLLSVLGCVSGMLIERSMRFGVVAILDVAVLVFDKGLAIALALAGYGAWAFIWASLASSLLRCVALNAAAPWPFGLAFDRALIRDKLSSGLWFQGINLATMARENLITLVAGPLFGPRTVGLLNWGFNLPSMVAVNLQSIFQRVMFPAFARLQDEDEARELMLERSTRILFLTVLPPLALLPVLGDPIVGYVYGNAWREALPALAWFTLRLAANVANVPLIAYFNALGQPSVGFRAMAASTVLEWVFAVALLSQFGFTGVAMGAAFGSILPVVGLWAYVRRSVRLSLFATLAPGLCVAALLGIATWLALPIITSLDRLIGTLVAAACGWLALALLIEREQVEGLLARWLHKQAG